MVEGNAKSLCLPLSLAIRDWDVPQHDEQGNTSMLTMDGEPIEDEDGLGSNKNKSKSLSRLSRQKGYDSKPVDPQETTGTDPCVGVGACTK
jgi:hypothetical protein